MDCREARAEFGAEVLAGHVVTGGAALSAARAHAAGCEACRAHFDHLSRAILSMAEDEISCAECTARLPDYLEAERAGVDAVAASPLVYLHLQACDDCMGDFQAARLALLDLHTGRLPDSPRAPRIDTSFLPAAPIAPSIGIERWAVAAAVLALVAIGGAVVRWGRSTAPSPTPSHGATGAGAEADAPAAIATAVDRQHPLGLVTPATPTPQGGIATPARPPSARPAPASTVAVVAIAAVASPTVEPMLATATATATQPTVVPTDQPTDAPGGGQGGNRGGDDPTATLTPDATPTPVMVWRCEPALPAMLGVLQGTCDTFPNPSEYDFYRFDVGNRSRWAFSLCGRTELDTVLALYPDGAFSPAAPCQGILAYNDDFCDRQSRLTVDLVPGSYVLVIAEKTGDVGGPYAFKVESDELAQGSACPVRQAP